MMQFSTRVLAWFAQHGRKHLPWQQPASPYRVWLSEIMLQQTQVNTVIPYFERFLQRFPTLAALAAAPLDDVLTHWAGLGYYARARNLHRTAQILVRDYAGEFPSTLPALQALPGIGRSTAGAILALSLHQRAVILDGNVKRVLARFHAIAGWPSQLKINNYLWELAEQHTPHNEVAAYTQAMMDLGATLCTRTKPQCTRCPLHTDCAAYREGKPTAYPTPKPSKTLPVKSVHMLLLQNQAGAILLLKKPPTGIWGGLWSLPECPLQSDLTAWCQQHYFCEISSPVKWNSFRHTFSHFHLDITPMFAVVTHWLPPLMESPGLIWYNLQEQNTRGMAAPVKNLLTLLKQNLISCHDSSIAKN